MSRRRHTAHGVSLVEAMVALAVMGFGTLAVLGVQATLRLNGDITKQRADAVRIAQQAIETAREFEAIGVYSSLSSDANPLPVAGYDAANTVYSRRITVVDAAAANPPDHPRRKGVVVDVEWADRTGELRSVRLTSIIEGTVPALAGSLAVPADRSVARRPGGRHPAIPPQAVPWGQDRSRFAPPGAPDGVGWVFANATADITQICIGPAPANCVDVNAKLLAGQVRFATAAAPAPGVAEARVPPGTVLDLPGAMVDVFVDTTAPASQRVPCFRAPVDDSTVAYHCAIAVDAAGVWSGRSYVDTSPEQALDAQDAAPDRFRVCRYTPFRDDRAVGVGGMSNDLHPLDYEDVARALTHQNFLVIRAGDGSDAFACPEDNDPNVFVTSNTWFHQPAPPPP